MWFHREVMPVRRYRARLWMIVPAAGLATAIALIAMPRPEPLVDRAAAIRANVASIAAARTEAAVASRWVRLRHRLAEIDARVERDRESTVQCDLHCTGMYERLMAERSTIAAQLEALDGL